MPDAFAPIAVDRPAPGVAVIHTPEDFDVYEAPVVRQVHVDLVGELVYAHVFDLSATCRIDSTGLGVLVGALKRLRARDGVVVLESPTAAVRHVLEVTGVAKIFVIVGRVGERMEVLDA